MSTRQKIIFIFVMSICLNLLFSQTQNELNNVEKQNYIVADVELNRVYNEIIKKYDDMNLLIEKLRIAQNAWIVYRDAHLESIYPAEEKYIYGSVYPMCYWIEMTRLTEERTEELMVWLIKGQQGEVCGGGRVKF